jgi:putative ABC transport system permease protein
MSALWQDFQYSVRVLRNNPTFTIAAVLTLALGVGANTAIFTAVNAVLVNPLPFKSPDELVFVMESDLRNRNMLGVSSGNFVEWKEADTPFSEAAGWRFEYFNLTGRDEPEQVTGLRVSSSFLPLLGAQPRAGRGFRAEDEQPGQDKVAVITDALWRRRFARDPSIIGQQVTIEREPYTVVGILPETFHFFQILNRPVDLYVPLAIDAAKVSRQTHDLSVYARLRPQTTLGQAQAQLDRVYGDLAARYPDSNAKVGITLRSLPETFTRNSRPVLWLLIATTVIVLLIACANVIDLMLARAVIREQEMNLRAALGADRLRLIRHVLVESVVVALLAGIAGTFLAIWGVQLLNQFVPRTVISRVQDFALSGRVIAFSFALSVVTGIVLGMAPALLSTKAAAEQAGRDTGRRASGSVRGRQLSRLAVIAEVALAVVLLSGALLLIRSARLLVGMPRGLNTDRVLTLQVWLPRAKYPEPHQVTAFYQDALQRISRLPGVESASAINFLPLARLNGGVVPFTVDGRAPATPDERLAARYSVVDPRYFRTMRVPILAGREFRDEDADEVNGVAIVDAAMAQRFWPNENPIGRQIRPKLPSQRDFWVAQSDGHPLTIVGVVGNIREDGAVLMGRSAPVLYVPYRQNPSSMMHLVVRTAADPLQWVNPVRRAIWDVDRDQPVSNTQTMNDVVAETFGQPQIIARMTGAFAVIALVLAALGVFALVCYVVSQRTREIGIRMALGAGQQNVFRGVLRDGAWMGLIGVGLGLVATVGLNRVIANLLFGVTASDPLTLASAALLLFVVTVAACYVPARRAMKVDPIVALRAG